ncbi:hypothetical protein [Aquibacillus rhizosphaerae]|uniref:Uncharacterized protein n=1 Tax=Aquibacillus rhizosphaerae TaxID=3051431 RepID=A0ABT7L3Z9_9BACI|nr:hypothetical protein [Aquibacillus sp. LR5S19]MDL4840579.1 hypothetical protein [Aquibacillus sp. LR5S19]
MLMAISVSLLSLILFRVEYKQVKKHKSKKDKLVFIGGCIVALYLVISLSIGLPIPSSSKILDQVFQPVTKPIANLLKTFQPK